MGDELMREVECGVDRDREGLDRARLRPSAPAACRRVETDNLAIAVDQRATRVARLDRGVGLDHPTEALESLAGLVGRGDRLPERCYRPGGNRGRAAASLGVAERGDTVADVDAR